MKIYDKITNKNISFLISIIIGTIVGLISVKICTIYNLAIYGFNIYIIISPIIAGFVETYLSKNFTGETSGAISSIILFIITNAMGWIFPANPITWNIFTVGGFILMIQAAFPLTINYLLLALMFLFIYGLGRVGSVLETLFVRRSKITPVNDMQDFVSSDVLVLTNEPQIPINKYHGLIFSEKVIEFEDKKPEEVIDFMGSDVSKKNMLKQHDYTIAKEYMLNDLKLNAEEIGANAIIDIEIEYTNYNQQFPPDVLIAMYGTAVTLDKKYLI
ncbi:MAG: heavy metal-binding domain-containing protein [Methanosphaera sp.]|nr:heavy metal-binding domain-containing protein [Methanosphaera sp.]